jgi:hypothetical protein
MADTNGSSPPVLKCKKKKKSVKTRNLVRSGKQPQRKALRSSERSSQYGTRDLKKKGKSKKTGKDEGLDIVPDDCDEDEEPTSSPTAVPTFTMAPTSLDVCKALENNEIITTESSIEVTFRYNMIRKNTVDSADAIKTVSDFIQKALAGSLLGCASGEVFTNGNARILLDEDTYIVGVGPGRPSPINYDHRSLQVKSLQTGGSGSVNPNVGCSSAIQGQQTAGTSCDAVDDSVTVYLVPDSPESSASSATDDTLTAIRNMMNNQANAVMAANNGIQGLLFVGQPGTSSNIPPNPGRIEGNSESPASGLSPAGVGLVVGSCALIAIIAFVALRRRRVTQFRTSTQYEDDDVELFSKTIALYSKSDEAATDVMSNASSNWRRARSAHVLGEGDSVSPGDTGSIIDDLRLAESRSLYGMSPHSAGLEEDLLSRDSHDVHRCQSATCEVCAQQRNLVFIPSDAPEGYLSVRSPAERSYHSNDTVHL